jgi:hypothetical protein
MKSSRVIVNLTLAFILLGAAAALAAGHGAPGHDMSTMKAEQYPGRQIRQTHTQDGWMLTYQLLDLKERAVVMKGMEGMEMPGMSKSPDITNHLVVYVANAAGKTVSAKVGFMITGPDKAVQQTLTMGMGGGYGADVILKAKGAYQIKTKAVVGDKTILDDFTHEVK